ncbi:MAG: DUF6428 family protein [Balneolaceae bacterium]
MKRSELTYHLSYLEELTLRRPDGSYVPSHFHITEAGVTTKRFIDCGGTARSESYLTLQAWSAEDTDHRLTPSKLARILELAQPVLGTEDLPVVVEYQQETVGLYDLEFEPASREFYLAPRETDCLAKDRCGIPETEKLETVGSANAACTPGGGCC